MQLHLPAHRLPLRLRDAGGDAAVGDDLDHLVRHEHVDQDTVVVRGVPHAELSEQLQRALPRRQIAPQLRQIEGGLDDEADLPGMMRFAAADGLFDGVANLRREVPARAPACGSEVANETQEFHDHVPPTSFRRRRRPRILRHHR